MEKDTDWLREILRKEELEEFYIPIRDKLQITSIAHFDYVCEADLEDIGISRPAIRRLRHAIKKESRLEWWGFWGKLFGSLSNSSSKQSVRQPIQTVSRTAHIISEQDITLHNVLGKGSFAVVRKGEWRMSDTGKTVPVACKVLKNGVHNDFGREVAAMHRLHHHNLMKLYGVVFQPYMMVCELAPMGALLDYIKSTNGRVSLSYIAKWSEQVAAGMAYLAQNRFLHRDLACRNILLSTLDLIKIGDFGLMRALPDGEEFYLMDEKHRERVPFPWCAPESLRHKQFSLASDVWMFAVALWEMYSFGAEPWTEPQQSDRGAQPIEFKPLSGGEIRQRIEDKQRLPMPRACPPDVYMLMMQCWDQDPIQRPTFEGIQRYMERNKIETAVAALGYRQRRQDEITVEAGDSVVLIDKRPDLHRWKGQNQKTLDIGLFPSNILKRQKSKLSQVKKKAEITSPSRKVHTPTPPSSVVKPRNKGRTIESTQPNTTRAINTESKQIGYNKLNNDRTLDINRAERDARSKSLNPVREGLLIDLNLPPATRLSVPPSKTTANNVSILDQPIDVPESNPHVDWGAPSTDSLPNFSLSKSQNLFTNLYETKSLDNLTLTTQANPPDPFDTSQVWPIDPRSQHNYNQAVSSAKKHDRYSTNATPTRPNTQTEYSNIQNHDRYSTNSQTGPNYNLQGEFKSNHDRYSTNTTQIRPNNVQSQYSNLQNHDRYSTNLRSNFNLQDPMAAQNQPNNVQAEFSTARNDRYSTNSQPRPNYNLQGEFSSLHNDRYSENNTQASTSASENLYINTSAYSNINNSSNADCTMLANTSSYNRYSTQANNFQGEFSSIQNRDRYSANNYTPVASSSENYYSNSPAYLNTSAVASHSGGETLPNNSSYNRYGALPSYGNVQNNSIGANCLPNNSTIPNGTQSFSNAYGTAPINTYSNDLSSENNVPSTKSLAAVFTEMSLNDKFKSHNVTNSENIYENSASNHASTSDGPNASGDALYNGMSVYGNFEINSAQQQLILEKKDFYTKGSTTANWSNGYDKNIYTPKEETEKLQNFSESLENSKNYSAAKYQSSVYGSSFDSASTSRAGLYDFVDETASNASNIYTEIDSNSVYGNNDAVYGNRQLYDEVYEHATPRPHRPAPPRPYKP